MKERKECVVQQTQDFAQFSSYKEWHETFGHLSLESLQPFRYIDGHMITSTPSNFQYLIYQLFKWRENKRLSVRSYADELFKHVYSDLSRKYSQNSLGKTWYYISFIDDKYRYIDVNFLKEKSKVFSLVKVYMLRRKNQ